MVLFRFLVPVGSAFATCCMNSPRLFDWSLNGDGYLLSASEFSDGCLQVDREKLQNYFLLYAKFCGRLSASFSG